MASYTDHAPVFSPYVQQQPIEAMLKVGMAKQAQYQQGYEKIQSSIDKVAGLELYRDQDKEYMQSKLNELGTKLKGIAAGDFSNFQLTNSVAGMASSVANDDIIQAGVASTARIKKGFSDMETATKAGKSSAANDWLFRLGVKDYANNKEVKATYNGGYEQWEDVDKPLIEKIKAAHLDSVEGDENVISYDANGKASINHDVLNHVIKEGLSSSKVRSIAMSVYDDPKYARQMQIDGLYSYKDYTPEKLYAEKVAQTDYEKQQILSQVPSLRNYATLSSGDTKVLANKNLQYGYSKLLELDNNLHTYGENIKKDFDGTKVSTYLESKLNKDVSEYSWSKESSKKEVDPQFTVNMEKRKAADQETMNSWTIKNYQKTWEKWDLDRTERQTTAMTSLQVKKDIADKKLDADGNSLFAVGEKQAVSNKKAEELGASSMYDAIDSKTKEQTQLFANIIYGVGVYMGQDAQGNSKSVNDFYIEKNNEYQINPKYINKDSNSNGVLTAEGGKIYEHAKAQFKNSSGDVAKMHIDGQAARTYADKIKNWFDGNTILNRTKAKAAEIEKQFAPVIEELTKQVGLKDNYQLHVHTTKEGKLVPSTINLSKSDMIDAALAYKNPTGLLSRSSDAGDQAFKRLKLKLGPNAEKIISLINGGDGNNSDTSAVAYSLRSALHSTEFKDKLNERTTSFKEAQRGNVINSIRFTGTKATDIDAYRKAMISEINNKLVNTDGDPGSGDYATALSLLEKVKEGGTDNNIYEVLYNSASGKYSGKVSQLTGGKVVNSIEVPLSKGFVQEYHLDSKISPAEIAFSQSKAGQLINLHNGTGTTDDPNTKKADIDAYDRQIVGKYSIGFQLKTEDLSHEKYIPYLYITDRTTGKRYNGTALDWDKIADSPGVSPDEASHLKTLSNSYNRLQINEATETFIKVISNKPDPNAIIKNLISSQDNK